MAKNKSEKVTPKVKEAQEAAPVAEAPAEAPRPNRKPRKPQPQDIKLSARQYVRARKHHWRRCAGFLYEMSKHHSGLKTRPEWDNLWDAYWARPVK